MPNMKITDKGNKYLSTLLQKNDNHILINEEFRLPLLLAMQEHGVIGSEFYTLIMVRHKNPYTAGIHLGEQLRCLYDEGYIMTTEEPLSLSEEEFLEIAGPIHGPKIIDAMKQFQKDKKVFEGAD